MIFLNAERFSAARLAAGLTISDIATKAKVTEVTVYRAMQGKGIQLRTLDKLCSVLRVPANELAEVRFDVAK